VVNFIGGEHHRPTASHWQVWSHNVVSSTPLHERDSNSQRKKVVFVAFPKYAAIRSKRNYLLSPWYSWKIVNLTLSNNSTTNTHRLIIILGGCHGWWLARLLLRVCSIVQYKRQHVLHSIFLAIILCVEFSYMVVIYFKYLELRFSRATRYLAGTIFAIEMVSIWIFYFDYERTRCTLFKKHVLCTRLYIYVFFFAWTEINSLDKPPLSF
jgi:hypothetical protein